MAGQSYACPTLKAVISPPKPHWVIIGTETWFYGSGSVGSIDECIWSLPAGAYDVNYYTERYKNDIVGCKFGAPGIYTVTLKVKDNLGRTDTDTCTVYAIRLGLAIKDAGDKGYLPVNEDDDNNNLIIDEDETGTVVGEDNLVEIHLSVEPNNLPCQVELLNWVDYYDRGEIKVWSDPNKKNLVIPSYDPGYKVDYKRWSPAALPKKLYVEGLNTTDIYDAALVLYIKPDGLYLEPGKGVCFKVIRLIPHYKENYDPWVYLLDDWPRTATELRSPKYIFGKNDPIYLQVDFLGIDPQVAEHFSNFVKVTSDSGGLVHLTLKETGPDTQVFNNIAAEGELLYLSDANSEGNGDKIKVVDEEVLTFWLEIQPGSGEYRSCKTVMVDKGEYAWFGIHKYRADGPEFKGEMEDSRVNWWEAGYLEYPDDCGDTMSSPIIRAGQNFSAILESDLMLVSCEGVINGNLKDNDSPKNLIMSPFDISNASDWNNDVDWVWLLTCDILNVAGGGRNAWDDALFGSPRPAHMILGYHGVVGGWQTGEIDNFFDYAAGQNDTIVSSFYHAITDGVDDPGAIVEHKDNDSDTLKVVTRDTSSTNLRYYWLAGTWQYTDYTRGAADQTQTRVYGNCQIELPGSLTDLRPELAPLEVELLALKSSPKGFNQFKRTYGLEVFWKPIAHEQILGQDEQMARDIAQLTLEDIFGEIPGSDDLVHRESTFYAVDFGRGEAVDMSAGIPLVRAVEYYHYYKGIPIEGDILSASVSRNKVVKVQACWHKPAGEKVASKTKVVDAEDALATAAEKLTGRFAGQGSFRTKLRDAKLCYYGFHDAGKSQKVFLPAWRFAFERDGRIYYQYVNAHSNVAIDSDRDIDNARRKHER
jgi:hypothetical protein